MAVFNEFPFTHYFQGFLVDANVLGGKYCTALITEVNGWPNQLRGE